MREIDAGAQLEQLAGQMPGAAVSGRTKIDFAGVGLYVIDEFLHRGLHLPRYDRLAKEVTKVTVILYSMTALTGGLFIFVLLATYPQFTTWLINHFFLVFAVVYPLLFISETILLYMTGLGNTAPPWVDGEMPAQDVLTNAVAVPEVTVGGNKAVVQFSGLAPCCSGLYQINFTIPAAAPRGEAVPLSIDGGTNRVNLAIQ